MAKSRRFYIFKVILPLILLIVLIVWVCSRWNVWFGNIPEPSYVIPNKVQRVLLTVGPDADSRYISWQDSARLEGDETTTVEYVDYHSLSTPSDTLTIESKPTVYQSRAGVGAFYHVLLKGLRMGESYKYRVRSSRDTTDWCCFEMDTTCHYSFLYMGDVQDELDGGFDSLLPSIMERNRNTSFLLFGGDLIERPMDCYWDLVFRSLDTFATRYPIVCVPGNHEYLKGLSRKLERRFTLTFPYYEVEDESDNALFSFAKGDARFFLLDSNKDIWDLGEQRDWLKKQLAECKEQWKIVVLHHPLHSIKGAANNLGVKAYFDGVVKEAGVDLVLQGHEHAYARSSVELTESGEVTSPLYVVTYCSRKDYAMKFYGDVEKWGTDDRFYQQISVSKDSLVVRTFGAEHNLYDDVVLVKDEKGKRLIDRGKEIPEKIQVSEWFRKNKSAKKVKKFEQSIREWKEKHGDENNK